MDRTGMRFVKTTFPIWLLAVLVISCYCNTLDSPPILDDFHTFVLVKAVHIQHVTMHNLLSLAHTQFGWARWIPMITFALDFLWGKGEIAYFHLTNIGIHLLCMLTVILLVLQVVKVTGPEQTEDRAFSKLFFAVAVAGLWALNPVQTNAVTYLVQRMASLETLFYTLAVSLYMLGRRRHRTSSLTWQVYFCYAGCALSAIGAFLSKENSAMLAPMLLMTEWWFFTPDLPQQVWCRLKHARRAVQLFCLLCLLLGGILFVHVFDEVIQGYHHRYFTMPERLLTESRIVVWYLSLLVLPLPSRLSLEHDVTLSTSLWNTPGTLLAIVFLTVLMVCCIRFRKRYPLMTYGGMWFFANLLIESTFVPLELVFEHRLYCPSIGFFLFFVAVLQRTFRYCFAKLPPGELLKLCWSTVAILCSCLALLTFERNLAWQNFITINADAAAKAPLDPRAHANLAVAYGRAGRYREALRQAELALKLERPHYEAYTVAGNVIVSALDALGETRKAIQRGDAILKNFSPAYDATGLPDFCLNLAQAHLKLQQVKAAYHSTFRGLQYASRMGANYYDLMQIEEMMSTIVKRARARGIELAGDGRPGPGHIPAEAWVAKRFAAVGEIKVAQQLLEQVLQKHPHQAQAASLLDSITNREKLNRVQRAKANFTAKYVYHPFSKFNICMAIAFLIQKNKLPSPLTALGEAFVKHAIELRPANPDAHLLMGWYFYEKGEVKQALKCVRYAIKLDTDNAKSWLGLGFFLIKAKQPQAAVVAFHKSLALYPGYQKRRVILAFISSLQASAARKAHTGKGLEHS